MLVVSLGMMALVVSAIAAIGLFGFKRWGRPLAVVSVATAAVCFAASFWLSPIFIAASSATHAVLLATSMLAWALALLLLRSAPVRNRFHGG